MNKLPIGILGSGKGSNCRAILEKIRIGELAAEARVVISDVPELREAGGEHAAPHGEHQVVVHLLKRG